MRSNNSYAYFKLWTCKTTLQAADICPKINKVKMLENFGTSAVYFRYVVVVTGVLLLVCLLIFKKRDIDGHSRV